MKKPDCFRQKIKSWLFCMKYTTCKYIEECYKEGEKNDK